MPQPLQYDATRYRKIDWKHFMMLHRIINPAVAFYEIVLGSRMPKVLLIERKKKNTILAERIFVPCPHCNTIHSSKTWSTENQTDVKNWFGLYCPSCGGIIPCLTNITTMAFAIVTAPLWFPLRRLLRDGWLHKQPQRYENINLNFAPSNNFLPEQSMIWGITMFVIMSLFDLAESRELLASNIIKNFILWVFFTSALYSITLHLFNGVVQKIIKRGV